MRNAVWAVLTVALVSAGCSRKERTKPAEPMNQPTETSAERKGGFALHITPPPGWVPLDKYRIMNPQKDSVIYFTVSSKKPLPLLNELVKVLREDDQRPSDVTADADGKGGWYTITGLPGERIGKGVARDLGGDPPLTLFCQGGWPPAIDREMTVEFDAIVKGIWIERK
jgi:hypothetical protein